MQTLLSPSACRLEEYEDEIETMSENIIAIKLFNNEGEPYYLDAGLNSE